MSGKIERHISIYLANSLHADTFMQILKIYVQESYCLQYLK